MNHLNPRVRIVFFWKNIFSSFLIWLAIIFYMVLFGLASKGGAALVWIFLGLIVLSYIWSRLTYRFYVYDLESEGLRIDRGVIFKNSVLIAYKNIQDVRVSRGPIARILGLSNLKIQTAGVEFHNGHYSSSQGRLPGLSKTDAQNLQAELLRRSGKN